MKRNYKDDFDFILRLYQCMTDAEGNVVEGSQQEMGWPDYDWTVRIWTQSKANAYVAQSIGGVLTNCYNDEGQVHIVVDNHKMGAGRVKVEFQAELPREIYPDGYQRNVIPGELDIELIVGRGDLPTEMGAEMLLPYIKGEPFTYEDFTEEQIAGLMRPAVEAAERADKAVSAAEVATEQAVASNEKLANDMAAAAAAETARREAETARAAAEQVRQTAESARQTDEKERQETEAARVNAEKERAENEAERRAAETARSGAETARATAEATRAANEAERQEAEAGRAKAEQARAAAEKKRGEAETQRAQAEDARKSAETDRKAAEEARKSSEAERQSAETSRHSTEQGRVAAENERKSAETARSTAEKARKDNEALRQTDEEARKNAEKARVSAESTRDSKETARQSAESARQTAEQGRVTAESARVEAEAARDAAETQRAEAFAGFEGKIDAKLDQSVWDAEHEQFGVVGTLDLNHGRLNATASGWRASAFIPLNRARPLIAKFRSTELGGGVFFYDAQQQFISRVMNEDTTQVSEKTIEPMDFPENAVFFRVCSLGSSISEAYYTNGETREAREGAVADAVAASKMALFVDEWNSKCSPYGWYNSKTGFFVLNGLADITYEQALDIMRYSTPDICAYVRDSISARTLIYMQNGYFGQRCLNISWTGSTDVVICSSCGRVETIRLSRDDSSMIPKTLSRLLQNCRALHTVYGVISGELIESGTWNLFANCPNMAHFKLTKLRTSLDLRAMSAIDIETLQYMVANAANTEAITITVHPDVYAKLTDTANADWHKVATDAAAKNISFATV